MVFLDTNIWNYALLVQDYEKREIALDIISRALATDDFAISTQVVSECANVMFKKGGKDPVEVARCIDRMRCVGTIVPVTLDIARRAVEIKALYGLQFYDAQIVAAAEKCGCDELWSEDMGGGATYCGVRCVNPFEK